MTAIAQVTPGGRAAYAARNRVLGEQLILDGGRIDPDIAEAVPMGGLILTGTMDGAESLEITVLDPNMELLLSGALSKRSKPPSQQRDLKEAAWDRFGALRLTFDGVFFRFSRVEFEYGTPPWQLRLVFESELATLMRRKRAPLKWSRADRTRLEFIDRLATASWASASGKFVTLGPGKSTGSKIDPVKLPKGAKKGLSPNARLTVKGVAMSAEQRKHATIVMRVCDQESAGTRATLAALCAAIGESNIRPVPNAAGSPYQGVFQAHPDNIARTDTKQQAYHFLHGGKGFQQGGAIKLARENQAMSLGEIAYRVEGSLANFSSPAAAAAHYDQHQQEAKEILAAWGGAGEIDVERESYEFFAGLKDQQSGKRENYWDASGRLAVTERNWRRFASRNALWRGPDAWFFQREPAFIIHPGPGTGRSREQRLADQGILGITGAADVGRPVSELVVRAICPRWTANPGEPFEFGPGFGALTGRWLIWQARTDLTREIEQAEITLRRPAPELREPAPKVRTRQRNPGDDARPLGDVDVDETQWAGTKSFLDQFVTPFLAQEAGLKPGSQKRTPEQNRAAGGSDTSDHLTTSRRSYAIDYPTRDGEAAARALAVELGYQDWRPNSYTRFNVTAGGVVFSVQILWGAQIGHDDHIHVGAQSTGKAPERKGGPASNLWHPGATRVKMADAGGFTGGGWKIVHHTTEGHSISGAETMYRRHRSAPHFTFSHIDNVLHQHIPLNRAARTLKHPKGTLETNRANAIQIEHVGFTEQAPFWSDTSYERIATLCRWIETAVGVPRSTPVSFLGPIIRLSQQAWVDAEGHVGHMHCPGNDHRDPLGFRIDKVL